MYKKILISIFILFHLTSIMMWNLNTHIGIPDKTLDFFKPYMYGMSIWQAWNIFSPDPYTKETSTRIIIEIENNEISYLPTYAKNEIPFLFTRFRKFNDNIIANKDPVLNTAYLIYLCKDFNKIYEPEFEINLEIMYKDIDLPPKYDGKISFEPLGGITCS